MALGFTESKTDSNFCFKVEGRRPVMLLLYVDELLLTGKEELICKKRKLARHGGVAECRWNLPGTREVCSRDPEEVRDDVMQGHDHTYDIEPEAIE